MKIFYALSTILLLSLQAKSQDRTPGGEPTPRIVKFYPNPATSIITFDFQQGYDKSYNLQIFNYIENMLKNNSIVITDNQEIFILKSIGYTGLNYFVSLT